MSVPQSAYWGITHPFLAAGHLLPLSFEETRPELNALQSYLVYEGVDLLCPSQSRHCL